MPPADWTKDDFHEYAVATDQRQVVEETFGYAWDEPSVGQLGPVVLRQRQQLPDRGALARW